MLNFEKTPHLDTRFIRYEKLKSRKITEQVFKTGKSMHCHPYRVCYLLSATGFAVPAGKAFGAGCPVQFGIGVSSRHFKKAVVRNRIKRLTREAWRLQKASLYTAMGRYQLVVFLIYTGKTVPVYGEVYNAVTKAIFKLGDLIQKQSHEAIT